ITVAPAVPSTGGSSKVKFNVAMPVLEEETLLLITLCIKISKSGIEVSIYFNKIILSTDTTARPFETLLPNGYEIIEASAYYDALY
ncbi:MAG: hypothetical protein ACRC68_12970, partial [Clostridium sp.]